MLKSVKYLYGEWIATSTAFSFQSVQLCLIFLAIALPARRSSPIVPTGIIHRAKEILSLSTFSLLLGSRDFLHRYAAIAYISRHVRKRHVTRRRRRRRCTPFSFSFFFFYTIRAAKEHDSREQHRYARGDVTSRRFFSR